MRFPLIRSWMAGFCLAASALAGISVPAKAQLSTGFMWQTKIMESGVPLNGSYDLQFKLYDAATGGAQIGSTLTSLGMPVSNGYYNLKVDFGTAPFTANSNRWIEVSYRPAGSTGAYTTYLPRTQVLAVPFALFAPRTQWAGVSGIPTGFADGIDNIGAAGTGLTLSNGVFSLNFGGSGTASTVSHSDHNHFGQTWEINASWSAGLAVSNTSTSPNWGLVGRTAAAQYGANNCAGVFGESTAPSDGMGVIGATSSTTGGAGVAGFGAAVGVLGYTGAGRAVWGRQVSASATLPAIHGETASTGFNAAAVKGEATASSGSTSGVWGVSASSSGFGVYGQSTSTSGGADGVVGITASLSGSGVRAIGAGATGTALQIAQGGIKVSGAGTNTNTPVFVHSATSANSDGYVTIIDNALCNNDPNAILIITQSYTAGNTLATSAVSDAVVIYWNLLELDTTAWPQANNKWVIYTNGSNPIQGCLFNVLVFKR